MSILTFQSPALIAFSRHVVFPRVLTPRDWDSSAVPVHTAVNVQPQACRATMASDRENGCSAAVHALPAVRSPSVPGLVCLDKSVQEYAIYNRATPMKTDTPVQSCLEADHVHPRASARKNPDHEPPASDRRMAS